MGGNRRKTGNKSGQNQTEQQDTSDTDSMSSCSTNISELTLDQQTTETTTSKDSFFDELIDSLYEKRGSTREKALLMLVDSLESFVLTPLLENKSATLIHLFLTSLKKKGSVKESFLACKAIGLLAVTLGAGNGGHEIMKETVPELSRSLAAGNVNDLSTMVSVLDCLAVVTFVGANDLDETQAALKSIWDVIHPKTGSKVGTVKKFKPPVIAAAINAWAFLLTTVSSWRTNSEIWKDHISHLSTLLDSEDRAVRMASGETIALFFEMKFLDISINHEDQIEKDPKYPLFLHMQAMKSKVTAQIDALSNEAGGKGTEKKNLSDQKDLFQKILDYIKDGWSPEESVKVSGKLGILRVSSWSELIQLNFIKRFLGKGFLKHAQDNSLLHEIFHFESNKTEGLSNQAKKIYRSEEEKGRALKLNKDRKNAQERKRSILNEQDT